jgi:hypothetical protein
MWRSFGTKLLYPVLHDFQDRIQRGLRRALKEPALLLTGCGKKDTCHSERPQHSVRGSPPRLGVGRVFRERSLSRWFSEAISFFLSETRDCFARPGWGGPGSLRCLGTRVVSLPSRSGGRGGLAMTNPDFFRSLLGISSCLGSHAG